MSMFRRLPVVVLVCWGSAVCLAAGPGRVREFTSAEAGLQLTVVVKVHGPSRTEVVLSLEHRGDYRARCSPIVQGWSSPVEPLGFPAALRLLTADGKEVLPRRRGLSLLREPGRGRTLKPGQRVETTVVLEELFACEGNEGPLALQARLESMLDEDDAYFDLEVTAPDVRNGIGRLMLPTED